MPSQQAEVAEAVAGLRRARDRDRLGSSRQPIYSATNRGHKLERGANRVRAGVLASTYGPERYREKIEHAGFTRYILERIPKRYDEYGNELDDSEVDEEADNDAADENAYSGIQIEELLCPLKHPSELATHPTLKLPYLDHALPDMVKSTEEKLQQERANLWRAKNLVRQFSGDRSWIPCGTVESNEDWDMFQPKRKRPRGQESKKRKRNNDEQAQNHQLDGADGVPNGYRNQPPEDSNGLLVQNGGEDKSPETGEPQEKDESVSKDAVDTEMKEADESTTLNGQRNGDEEAQVPEEKLQNDAETASAKGEAEQVTPVNGEEEQTSEVTSPALPPRRITRALAATNNSNAATPPLSPTPTLTDSSTSSSYQIDPLFLLPTSITSTLAREASTSTLATGLPLEEAIETRKLLTVYIQKQEESVRGYEAVLAKLIKAKRMRDDVLEACTAEGHVGEMSDGEDWIDYQKWNLKPGELKKGRDEDDDGGDEREVAGIGGGRKGKRRRN